jgi:hypothetical protein
VVAQLHHQRAPDRGKVDCVGNQGMGRSEMVGWGLAVG